MHWLKVASILTAGLFASLPAADAAAQVVVGHLEVQWGDSARVAPGQHQKLRVAVVTRGGVRVDLDSASASRAAADLHALANREVAVEFGPRTQTGALRQAAIIVPVDRPWLSASSPALHAPKAATGNTRWATLACKFKDVLGEPRAMSFFQEQLGTSPGQLGHYWNEVSQGKLGLQGSQAYGWFTLPKNRSQYMSINGSGQEQSNLGLLFDDCVAAADPSVSFEGVGGINLMFNTVLDGRAWGGNQCGTLDGRSVCLGTTWNPPWSYTNAGLIAHEMGHAYGLFHSDNSDGDSDTYDNPWDLMSDYWSDAVDHPRYGRLPKHLSVAQQERLGWYEGARKRSMEPTYDPVEVAVDRSSCANCANVQMLVLVEPFSEDRYTLEVRKRTAPGTYESELAGDAVIIHRISAGASFSVDADMPPATVSNNEGSMFKVGEQWISPRNTVVHIKAATAEGFVVEVKRARETGGNLPARRSN